MKVLGRVTSINVRKVLWLLDEVGLAYEREDWGLPERDPGVPEFLKLNPNAQVPVIVDGEFVLWESGAIMRYLGQKSGSESWPTGLEERALVDQWMTWQATELNPSWGYPVAALMRKRPGYDDAGKLAAGIAAWNGKMRLLEAQLQKAGDYVVNGRFSLADIVLALSTHRYVSVPFDKPDLPAVMAHYERMRGRVAAEPHLGPGTP